MATSVVFEIEPMVADFEKTCPSTTTWIAVDVLTHETVCHWPSLTGVALEIGIEPTVNALRARRTGLAPCAFETAQLETCVGQVADANLLPVRPDLLCQHQSRPVPHAHNASCAWPSLLSDFFNDCVPSLLVAEHE